MTARALAIGFACVALMCLAVAYCYLYLCGAELAANHLPAAAVLLLAGLAGVVNPLVGRLWPKKRLTRPELIVIYVMMLVSAAIPGRAYLAYLYTVPAGAQYYSGANTKWTQYVHPNLPGWAWVRDGETARRLFEGVQPGQRVDWLAWMPQVLSWSAFFFLLCAAYLSLSVMFRRQWMEAERLAYPLTQVPLEVAGEEDGRLPAIFREKWMWVGFAVVCALHGLNGLHEYLPFLPSVRLTNIVVIGDVKDPPWNALANTKLFIYPSVIGIGFLLGGEVGLSLWLFFLLNRLTRLLLGVFGFLGEGQGLWSAATPAQFQRNQETGAFYALAVMVFLDLRRHMKATFSGAPSAADIGERRTIRWAAAGLAVSSGGLMLWDRMFGMAPSFSAWSLVIYYAIGIGMSRLVAASGIFFAAWSAEWLPSDAITQIAGNPSVPPGTRTGIYYQQAMFFNDRRTLAMPYYTDGLRLSSVGELGLGKTVAAMGAAVVFAMALSAALGMWFFHHHGAMNLREEVSNHIPMWCANRLQGNLEDTTGGSLFALGCQASGAGVMVALTLLHRHFTWWKLSPVGYLMGRSYALARLWLPVLIGWLFNALILRYGGLRTYRRARPFFIGLILGEFASVGLWLAIDALMGKRGHDFFPGAWPAGL